MIPPVAVATDSTGEKKVFALLEATDLGAHAIAIHSLNISEHEYKLCGELDFIVLCPEGLFVLEVKGGGVALHDGIWTYTDRFGRGHKNSEGPFRQARSGMFSLRDRIRADVPAPITKGLVFGHGVVLPETHFADVSPEWAPAMVIDLSKIEGKKEIAEPLHALIDYWKAKTPRAELLPPARLGKIAEYLRPEFDKVPSLRYRADQIYAAMEELTEEQYHQLDLVEGSNRVLCSGGAGTGKSFLAAEVARRDAARGSRVLLTCRSPFLATFLRQRLTLPNIDVAPLHEALGRDVEPYDVLVVDEAQDVLDFDTLDGLSGLLEGGLEDGRWRVFYDANNQSSLTGIFDPEALEYLQSLSNSGGTLRRNCRNTKAIVVQTRLLTHADLGNPTAGWGPPPTYEFFDGAPDAARLLEGHLRSLLDDDVAPGDITIVSMLPYEESCVTHMKRTWREKLSRLDAASAAAWPPNQITFATVEDFKGLENQFIAVIDVHSLNDDARARNRLYVAMSRARAGLWIAVDSNLREELENLKRANADDLREDPTVVSN